MKISVFNLKVIKTKINDNDHYLICRETLLSDTFKEVLTGRKVIVESPNDVEALSNYYPILGVANYKTGKPLTLGKKDILIKCIEINIYKAKKRMEEQCKLSQDKNNIIDNTSKRIKNLSTIERIEESSRKMFPKTGSWSSSEFRESPTSLIQHLRDNNWLATRLQSMDLEDINFSEILEYVSKNPDFAKLIHDYEQSIVKWQIEWMRSGGEGWLVPEGYGEDFALYLGTCDIAFRKGVVLTLTAINMNIDAIEEGIESNSDLWLLSEMKSAYYHTYHHPFFSNINLSDIPEDKEHEEKWLKLRMYEYYQEHKESVDKYGKTNEYMLITPEEADEIRVYLAIKHEEKMAELEQTIEKSKNNGSGFKLTPVDYFA